MEYLGEKICELCNNHYNRLPSKGKPGHNQWTVLSAVVMEFKGEFSVVTMATGTKCVGEKQRNVFTVSDSHAEVLSLRLFRLYLVEEMSRCLQGGKSICVRRDSRQKFKVKEGVFFHFYSSCVMCGDATVSEIISDQSATSHSNNATYSKVPHTNPTSKRAPSPTVSSSKHLKLDNVSRTGAKCLVDDDLHLDTLKSRAWHKTWVLRSKPGRGPVSLSLSCSDKLMKRQFLGLQGGLLSGFLSDPIRFNSMSIGGDFSLDSVKRALFGRLPDTSVPPAYVEKVEDLFVNSLENCKSRSKDNEISAASSSLLWMNQGETDLHWVGVKGRIQGATKSAALEKVMLPVCRASMLKEATRLLAGLSTNDTPSAGDTTNDTPSAGDTTNDTPSAGDTTNDTPSAGDTTNDTPSAGDTANDTPSAGDTTNDTPSAGDTRFSIKEGGLKDQYQRFRHDSWYRTNKLQFCKYFEGWDRKKVYEYGNTGTNKNELKT